MSAPSMFSSLKCSHQRCGVTGIISLEENNFKDVYSTNPLNSQCDTPSKIKYEIACRLKVRWEVIFLFLNIFDTYYLFFFSF